MINLHGYHRSQTRERLTQSRLPRRHTYRSGTASPALVLIWLAVVSTGIGLLWRYEHTKGDARPSPLVWPLQSEMSPASKRFTLVMFAHPKCPCTRASVGELSRIMTQCRDQVAAYAVFIRPPGVAEDTDWENTDLWASTKQIPGVTLLSDHDGVEADLFKADTSGFTVLYDAQGQLRFRGGITSSRGHSGDNAGRTSIVNLIREGTADTTQTPVFGCPLRNTPNPSAPACCQP